MAQKNLNPIACIVHVICALPRRARRGGFGAVGALCGVAALGAVACRGAQPGASARTSLEAASEPAEGAAADAGADSGADSGAQDSKGAAAGANRAALGDVGAPFYVRNPALRPAWDALQEGRPREAASFLANWNKRPGASCESVYVEARAAQFAGLQGDALAAFMQVAGERFPTCGLRTYAAARGAELASRLGRGDVAAMLADSVPLGHVSYGDMQLVAAEARASERPAAIAHLRAAIAASARPARKRELEWKLGNQLCEQGVGDPARADEALSLLRSALTEVPRQADAAGGFDYLNKCSRALRGSDAALLTAPERGRRALAWAEAADAKRTIEETEGALAAAKADAADLGLCRLATARAQVAPRNPRAANADLWGDAIKRCDGQDEQVTALYTGAKASVSAGRNDEAMARFATVEAKFPKHRFADDARFRAAQLAQQMGDSARAEKMLATLATDYPDGDMIREAAFHRVLPALLRGEYAAALPALEAGCTPSSASAPLSYTSSGRLEYFRARALQATGGGTEAAARYGAITQQFAGLYYGVLAARRLHELVPAAPGKPSTPAAEAALPATQAAMSAAQRAHLQAGLALLGAQDPEYARREIDAAELTEASAGQLLFAEIAGAYARNNLHSASIAPYRGKLNGFLGKPVLGAFQPIYAAAYPRAFESLVQSAAARYEVPQGLVWGIMREESSFDPNATSVTHALGLMQMMGETAKWMATGTNIKISDADLKTPAVSIELGAKLLRKLQTTENHLALAIAAYNAGSGSVRNWKRDRGQLPIDLFVETIPYEETRNYVKRVLGSMSVYAALGDGDAAAALLAMPLAIPTGSGEPAP